MAYQMAATAVILNDLEGHSHVLGFFKCNPSNTYAALTSVIFVLIYFLVLVLVLVFQSFFSFSF